MDPVTVTNELYQAGGLTLVLLAGMGFGLWQIGRYIAAERDKDRSEKEKLAVTFNGALKQIGDDHRTSIVQVTTTFQDEIRHAREQADKAQNTLMETLSRLPRMGDKSQ